MQRLLTGAAIAALCTISPLATATPGTVTKTSELRSSPALDASIRGKISDRTAVDILSTKGGWVEIKTADGKTGWLRLMNVEPLEAKASGSALKGLVAAGNVVRTGSVSSTAATGVKGISKEELAAAKPDFSELAQLDRYRASPADGQQHARNVGLKAQNVDGLPAGTATPQRNTTGEP